MKSLLSIYGFNNINQYFEYINESYINGQYNQVFELIEKMPKKYKKLFLHYALDECLGREMYTFVIDSL